MHRPKQLFHEYLLDARTKVETARLLYQRLQQRQLRANLHSDLEGAVTNGIEIFAGSFVLLASSFKGGAREMRPAYQDAHCQRPRVR